MKRVITIALTMLMSSAAFAQFIPPHSNDPHPPANQPSYQLPSPLSRPGVPQFPGAAHSNDPYYRKNTARPSWPQTMPAPDTSPTLRYYPPSSTPPAMVRRRAEGRQVTSPRRNRNPVMTLQQCLDNWDRNTGMTRKAWNSTCRRLANSGRIGVN